MSPRWTGVPSGISQMIVEAPPPDASGVGRNGKSEADQKAAGSGSSEPIGTSHFESTIPMTVARGTSAMVSILSTSTEGQVVFFYDPESARGNMAFPFRAIRIRNPTDSVLESGPVTVFGEGKFIGEGLCDPILVDHVVACATCSGTTWPGDPLAFMISGGTGRS